ncbi:Importin-alpha re-exporter [Intoshia linei]|uniref:Exportin-2 n=1 Tax=Intoshia linei TaxID=1819745 RepID=A0A177B8N7_9BILA|nr:Importin-alpha re-exporter [Intoshia linei]
MNSSGTNVEKFLQEYKKSLSVDFTSRNEGLRELASFENQDDYPVILLRIVESKELDNSVRTGVCVMLKHFLKKNWNAKDGLIINDELKIQIRANIVELMLNSPSSILKQITVIIANIGVSDFPEKWPDLMPNLMRKFESSSYIVINGILRTVHSICEKYRTEYPSDKLWMEIKYVLSQFVEKFTSSFLDNLTKIFDNLKKNPLRSLEQEICEYVSLNVNIFFDLNIQDLPEFFEDNIKRWVEAFMYILNAKLENNYTFSSKDTTNQWNDTLSAVYDCLIMYQQKYASDGFSEYLESFFNYTVELLTSKDDRCDHDLLSNKAISFLTEIARSSTDNKILKNYIPQLCEFIIMPNINMTESDLDLFENSPDEYIQRDMEGSDMYTRRRAACDLTKEICEIYEEDVIKNFLLFIKNLYQQFSEDKIQNWAAMDTAIYLLIRLATRGKTEKSGVTKTTQYLNMKEIFENHIMPILVAKDVSENSVVIADCLKFTINFRTFIDDATLINIMPIIAAYLQWSHIVVQTYAAMLIEKITNKDTYISPRSNPFTLSSISPHVNLLFTNLFSAITDFKSNNINENNYVLQAINNICLILSDSIASFAMNQLEYLLKIVNIIKVQCTNPHFKHFVFEIICVIIINSLKGDPSLLQKFEMAILLNFQTIISDDIIDFVPYTFQIIALLIERHSIDNFNYGNYEGLLNYILSTDVLWKRTATMPACLRLLVAFISKKKIIQQKSEILMTIAGLFQSILNSNRPYFATPIANALFQNFTSEELKEVESGILKLVLTRYETYKTLKYRKAIILCICINICAYGGKHTISTLESIMSGVFSGLITSIFETNLCYINTLHNKKIVCVACTSLLTKIPDFYLTNGCYNGSWLPLLQSTVKMVSTNVRNVKQDEEMDGKLQLKDLQGGYNKLVYAISSDKDTFSQIDDIGQYIIQQLGQLSNQCPEQNIQDRVKTVFEQTIVS